MYAAGARSAENSCAEVHERLGLRCSSLTLQLASPR